MHHKLPEPFGRFIQRSKKIQFSFEGKSMVGFSGDTIASALHRNGEKILSRSFKYHRPRGIFSLSGQDANTLVQLPEEGNVNADTYPISNGLKVSGQHYNGTLKNDRFSLFGKFSKFLPVGFYYRAFYKNDSWNRYWGNFFRKFTGLGIINPKNSGPEYDKKYLFYDLVIVGSGPAGLRCALTASEHNLSILLVEQEPRLGGTLNYVGNNNSLRDELVEKITQTDNIDIMTDATCNGLFSDNWLSIISQKRLYKTRTKQLLLCTGVFEQPIVFRNNDLPGIMLGTAAQRLGKLYGVKPGNNAVVCCVGKQGLQTALDLLEMDVKVVAIVNLQEQIENCPEYQTLLEKGIRILNNHTIYEANSQGKVIKSVQIGEITAKGTCQTNGEIIKCDLLILSGGNMPTYQLPCHSGATVFFDESVNRYRLENIPPNCSIVGSANGFESLDLIEKDALFTTKSVLKKMGFSIRVTKSSKPKAVASNFAYTIFEHPKGKDFIDVDEDLQVADIINAVREGYEDIQLVKRFSTLGMGPSQGRYCAYTSSLLVANYHDKKTINEVGVTTARPPLSGEKIGVLAGRNFYPQRHSNMHHRHLQLGAQPLIAGAWIRPAFYGAKDKMAECVKNESLNVHNNVGIVDVSTLGGIEVRGPDASEFINRVYTWNFLKQPVGKVRYALLTNESGVVVDDGVACRLKNQLFYITATTGGVDNVYLQFLKWNAQWRLNVDIANVTNAWCGVNIAGPNSRKVISKICQDISFSAEEFPYLCVKEGTISNIPARILRVGFVGELGYEIHVPQHYGEALWDIVMEAGTEFNIMPFGIETQRLLRLEKGHVIISQDTDSTTYPEEINMSWAVAMGKPFFVGQRSIEIVAKNKPIRKLIGFEITDSSSPIVKESHLCFDNKEQLIGRITSVAYSPLLGKIIGMAYISPKFSKIGKSITIRCDNRQNIQAKVVNLPFYDPKAKRQQM